MVYQRNGHSQTGALKGLLGLVLFIALVVVGAAYTFGYVVPPGSFGVRKIGMGPGKGFHNRGLSPGYHWGVPLFGYAVVYLMPETVQILHMHSDRKRYPESTGRLVVQTTDGVKVLVDMSLFFRFFPAPGKTKDGLEHGGPADLIQATGITSRDWFNRVRRDAEDELRRALGKLAREQFYDPFAREKQVAVAQTNMNQKLAKFGVQVEDVLVRRYSYEEVKIDEEIFRKNLQVQEKGLNDTLHELAIVTAELEKVKADWDAKIKTLKVEGASDVKVFESEGKRFEQEQVAQGDLLVARARAEVDRLTRKVLSNSIGAEIYVARELAPILGSLKGGVVQGIDPYNLDDWVERLGVKTGEEVEVRGEQE